MFQNDKTEYNNRRQMEETTARVFARLHNMKTILCKTLKRTYCGTKSDLNRSCYSFQTFVPDNQSDYETIPSEYTPSEDTISSISDDSMDSGVSTLSDCSHYSSSSSTLLLNPSKAQVKSSHLRCDPSIINYLSHNLLTTHGSDYLLDEDDIHDITATSSVPVPLAESSRRLTSETDAYDQTITVEDDDETMGPLTSTFIDRWCVVHRAYSATFCQDLTVRKNELVQVLRSTHPHWVWVRNEASQEGFVPSDCFDLC